MQVQKLAKILIKSQKDRNFSINFMQVIKKNKLEYLLPAIQKVLQKIEKDANEKSLERIISPFLLEENTEKELISKYKLSNIKQVVDKKIIAGFKIYTKDKIVDASLDTIFKNFTRKNS